jgi:hypothetical protein
VHSTLLRHDIPIVEHMTNLDQVPDLGFRFHAVPVKVKKFGTFPVRAFSFAGAVILNAEDRSWPRWASPCGAPALPRPQHEPCRAARSNERNKDSDPPLTPLRNGSKGSQ